MSLLLKSILPLIGHIKRIDVKFSSAFYYYCLMSGTDGLLKVYMIISIVNNVLINNSFDNNRIRFPVGCNGSNLLFLEVHRWLPWISETKRIQTHLHTKISCAQWKNIEGPLLSTELINFIIAFNCHFKSFRCMQIFSGKAQTFRAL